MDEQYYAKLLDYSLRLLSIRPRSIKELESRLSRYCNKKKFPETQLKKIISYLKKQDYLNDEKFCLWWIENRRSYRPKGDKAIIIELKAKGVSKDIIQKAFVLSEGQVDEFELAKRSISRKMDLYKSMPFFKKRAKIAAFLQRRGFSWAVISRIIDSIRQKG